MQHDAHDPRFGFDNSTTNDHSIETEIERIAALPSVEYERVRKDEAKRLIDLGYISP